MKFFSSVAVLAMGAVVAAMPIAQVNGEVSPVNVGGVNAGGNNQDPTVIPIVDAMPSECSSGCPDGWTYGHYKGSDGAIHIGWHKITIIANSGNTNIKGGDTSIKGGDTTFTDGNRNKSPDAGNNNGNGNGANVTQNNDQAQANSQKNAQTVKQNQAQTNDQNQKVAVAVDAYGKEIVADADEVLGN